MIEVMVRRWPALCLALAAALLVGLWALLLNVPVRATNAAAPAPIGMTGAAPALLIENVGQFDPGARFLLKHGTGATWLAEDGLWVTALDGQALLAAEEQRLVGGDLDAPIPAVHLKLSFSGANPRPVMEPYGRQKARVSYFLGSDPAAWRADVPVWSGVRYRNIYPGIDLIVGEDPAGRHDPMLPWHLEVREGADLADVQLRIEGADSVAVEGSEMRLATEAGALSLPLLSVTAVNALPGQGEWVVIDIGATVHQEGPGSFSLSAPLALPGPDLETALARPTAETDLVYSTYLGGSDWDRGFGVATDSSGAIYVAGRTPSTDFPTTPLAFKTTLEVLDAYVVKLNPAGTGAGDLVYATFVGGSAFDSGYGLALLDGEAYLTGDTNSMDLPTTGGAYDRICGNGGDQCDGAYDAFVARLNSDGTALLYGTYVGGGNVDAGSDVAILGGEVYVTGSTVSADFPTTSGAYDRTCGTDGKCNKFSQYIESDAFFVKLATAGNGGNDLLYSTFIGGADDDLGSGIAASAGDAFVAGGSKATIAGFSGYAGGNDAFVARIDPAGNGVSDLAYGRFLGGVNYDSGNGIAARGSTAYVTGETRSTDFLAGMVSNTYGGGFNDAFLVQLDGQGAVSYAAFLGGSNPDWGGNVAVDDVGAAVVVGYTRSYSDTFPVTEEAYDRTLNGGLDVFAARVDLRSSEPEHITYATYLGGSGGDECYSVALDEEGYAYLTGYTASSDFPTTTGAFDTVLSGSSDGFVAKLQVTRPPALDIQKSTNGLDADEPPGPYLVPRVPVTWTYLVRNSGDYALDNIVVSDDQGLSITCPASSLQPEASMTCTATGMAGEGQYANLGMVTGEPPPGLEMATDTDPSYYFGAVPGIDLEKHTNGEDADMGQGPLIRAGETVTWTYLVTNTGNVTLSGIGVMDDPQGAVACPYTSLAPKQSMTCILTGTAGVGGYSNTAVVTGTPPGGFAGVTASDASHYFGAEPIVTLEKRTNDEDADTVPGPNILTGETVAWTYLVTNQGNVGLTAIAVSDDGGAVVSCPVTDLAPGGSTTCTATGIAVAGQYTNTGTVTATPPVGADVSAGDVSHYFGVNPAVATRKQTMGKDAGTAPGPYIEAGDLVTWTYLVTNTGNVALTNVTVVDDQGVTVDCGQTTLAVSETMVCEATDLAVAGQYTNTGTASGTPPLGADVSASDVSHYFGSDPSLALEKLTNDEPADRVPGAFVLTGDAVTWTYVVTNTGNVLLTDVTVTDDQVGPISCPTSELGPRESTMCEASGVAVTGQYTNTGTVTGAPPVGAEVWATDLSHYFGAEPGIVVEKHTAGEDADLLPGPYVQAGGLVTWTYLVTNTGNVTLTQVTVVDDKPSVTVSCPQTTLVVSEMMTCTATGTAVAGQYVNVGTATGVSPEPLAAVSDTDLSHYYGVAPAIDVEKLTEGADADDPTGPTIPVGRPVAWTYVVQNVGNVPLSEAVVVDSDPAVTVACPKTTLAVDESMTCTASGIAETGQYSNTGTVTATAPLNLKATDSDPSHYLGINPAIEVEKRTNGRDADQAPGPYIAVGETVTWTYQLTNTGDILLLGVAVHDDILGSIQCPVSMLSVRQTMTCTRTGVALPGQRGNVATVTATPLGASMTVWDTDPSHYFGAELVLDVEKATNGQDADAPPGPLVLAGKTVTWTYLITNSSNVTLTAVSVSDDKVGPVLCPGDTLASGEWMSCTVTGTAQSDQYANVGTVEGEPPGDGDLSTLVRTDSSHYYGAAPAVAIEKRTNGQDADGPPGPYLPVTTPVTWTYIVSNTGNVELTDVMVSDEHLGLVPCPKTKLLAREVMTCTMNGTAGLGQYANTSMVVGTPPIGPAVRGDDASHYFGIDPAIQIVKYTNGEDANDPPGPRIYAGDAITWTYEVLNSGDIMLTNVTVSDDQGVAVECPETTLPAAATMTCTGTGTAVVGQYANVGSVTGTPPGGPDVSDKDASHYQGRTAEPAIDLEKSTNGLDADLAPGPYIPVGTEVTWEYLVTNVGNVEVISITVTDDRLGVVSCPRDSLGEGKFMRCRATGPALPGQYGNTATVAGTGIPGGLPPVEVSDSDDSHYFGSAPAIQVEKRTNGVSTDAAPGPYLLVGQPVTWQYLVSNTGNVSLSGITLVDDQVGVITCPKTILAAGASMSCMAGGEAAGGQYSNTATVTGTPPVGLAVTANDTGYYFGVILAVTFDKWTNGQDADTAPGPIVPVGEPVTWTYHLTSTSASNVALVVAVTDSREVDILCQDTILDPGEAITCTAVGSAQAGQYANTGTVTLTMPGDLAPLVLSDASHYFGSDPAMVLEKRTNGHDADTAPGPFVPVGQTVSWTYHVTNTGNITLTEVSVIDSQGAEVSCPQATLGLWESMTCTASGTAERDQYENIGSVTGKPSVGEHVSANDASHYFGSDPDIVLEKRTNGLDADVPPGPTIYAGEMVTWTYEVTNNGNVTLTQVMVSDDREVAITCPGSSLPPGQSMTCTATGTAEAGQYSNVGTASGESPDRERVEDSDASHYFGFKAEPAIAIEKRTNGQVANLPPGPYLALGSPVLWTYLVSNPGNVPLSGIMVTDDQNVEITCPRDTLAEGESMTCTASGTAQPGQYANRGTARGTPPINSELTAFDDSHYFGIDPGLVLEKRTNGQDADEGPGVYVLVGDEVLWTYHVANTGNVPLTNVKVTDDRGVQVSCPQTTLAPGEPMVCTAGGIAFLGAYRNVGTAVGTLPTGTGISANDASHYFGIDPAIEIQKYTNGQDADEPPGPYVLEGLELDWAYEVRNTGNIALAGVTVTDDQGVAVECPGTTLAAREVMTCTAGGVAEIGQYANVGTVTATHPAGGTVTASDPSHYLGLSIRPAIDVEKYTNGQDADQPPGPKILVGQQVQWKYVVANVSTVEIANITLVDDRLGEISCPKTSLKGGASMECLASGPAERGQYSNLATVTATAQAAGGSGVVTDTDPSHYFGEDPEIALTKLVNGLDVGGAPGPAIPVGGRLVWTYVVGNPGNVPLSDIRVVDDRGTPGEVGDDVEVCTIASLGAGLSQNCTLEDVAGEGLYSNAATVTASYKGMEVSDSDRSYYVGAQYHLYLPLVLR
jgi:uncharacterized repeat protein (TIGR01451 family)